MRGILLHMHMTWLDLTWSLINCLQSHDHLFLYKAIGWACSVATSPQTNCTCCEHPDCGFSQLQRKNFQEIPGEQGEVKTGWCDPLPGGSSVSFIVCRRWEMYTMSQLQMAVVLYKAWCKTWFLPWKMCDLTLQQTRCRTETWERKKMSSFEWAKFYVCIYLLLLAAHRRFCCPGPEHVKHVLGAFVQLHSAAAVLPKHEVLFGKAPE